MQGGAFLVGVAGGSGSGKTTLIRAVRDQLPAGAVCLISQDDYYRPIEEQARDAQGRVNFDLPEGLDLDQLAADLRSLSSGVPVRRREYTFNMDGREAPWLEVRPAPVILVEGLFVLHHAPLRALFHLKVFVEAGEGAQLERRLVRDMAERGYGTEEIRYQWEHHVMPAYRSYLLPYRTLCDLEVVNEGRPEEAVGALRQELLQRTGMAERIEPAAR